MFSWREYQYCLVEKSVLSGAMYNAGDKDLMQRIFYPMLFRSMLKCPFAMLKATGIIVAYKILTFSEKIKLGIWCELSAMHFFHF